MGIDAVIYAKLNRPATEDEIRDWSFRIGAAFGHDRFFIQQPRIKGYNNAEPHGAITLREIYHEDVDDYNADPFQVNVGVFSRYYGPGYERGDWAFLRMVILWMKANMPEGSVIYYGGDSDDGCEEVNERLIAEIDECFFKTGRQNYHMNRHVEGEDVHGCPLCKVAMPQYGFGGGYQSFQCLGCGYKLSTKDNGLTWKENAEGVFE